MYFMAILEAAILRKTDGIGWNRQVLLISFAPFFVVLNGGESKNWIISWPRTIEAVT